HQLQRGPAPRPARPGVGQAAPQVDDLAAVAVDAQRRAHVTVAFEVVPGHIPDPLEARRHVTLDRAHRVTVAVTALEVRARVKSGFRTPWCIKSQHSFLRLGKGGYRHW